MEQREKKINIALDINKELQKQLSNSKLIKYLLFHCCPKMTDASRLALEDYMTNNSNQRFQHLTWTIY